MFAFRASARLGRGVGVAAAVEALAPQVQRCAPDAVQQLLRSGCERCGKIEVDAGGGGEEVLGCWGWGLDSSFGVGGLGWGGGWWDMQGGYES